MINLNKFKTLSRSQSNYFAVAALSLILLVVLCLPYSSTVNAYFSQHQLMQSNLEYLTELEKKDRNDLLLLAGIDGFLSLVDSSELGVSFIVDAKIQVGSILSPLMDVTKNAFESTLASLFLTVGMQEVLSLVAWLSPYFAKLLLFLISVYCLLSVNPSKSNWFRIHVKSMVKYVSIIFVTLHLLIPYSVHFSAQVDKAVYQSLSSDISNDLENLHHEIVSKNDTTDVKQKAENTIKNLERMLLNIPEKTEALISYYSGKVIFGFLRMILLPSLMILMLIFFTGFYSKRFVFK